LVDYVAMDVKAPFSYERFREITGIDSREFFERTKRSVEMLLEAAVDYEFRTTLAPNLSPQDVIEIAGQIKGAKRFVLQQFAA
jgi:pyruvate formate lyase activating enzyme